MTHSGILTDPTIADLAIDLLCDGLQAAVLIYDRSDQLVYAGGQLQLLAPLPASSLTPGTRLRDVVAALFDAGGEAGSHTHGQSRSLRESWIADTIASLWRERAEHVEQRSSDRWLHYSKRRFPNGYGVCIVRDISEQKKREEQSKAVGERMELAEQVLDKLPFPVSIKSSDMVYVAVNQSFCKIVGRSPEELIGRKACEVFDPVIADRIEAADRQIIRNGISVTSPELLIGKDGEHVKTIVRKFRIGKPGRYQVVAALEDLSGLVPERIESTVRKPARTVQLGQHGMSLQDLRGRNVLVVTTEQNASDLLPQSIAKLGAEAVVVGSAEELELFLSFSDDLGVVVDLVLVLAEKSLLAACTMLTEAFQVPLVVLDRSRTDQGLHALVSEIFTQEADDEVVEDGRAGAAPCSLDVLVAEDNAVNQIVFSQILEGLGYRYSIAADGEEAVRLWKEHKPRLVLMDITLPKMNGFDACRQIRGIEERGSSTPIVGVLAQPFDHDREQCFLSGMDDVILKPISPEMLESVLLTYLQERDVNEGRKSAPEGRQVC
ncbi:response regulator [Pseudorhizobium flavum]|uniref:response regulator n=1 Tax=Pseudorhizobium flavum TaxID=1335061 RepID=UPI00376FCF6B